MDHSVGDNTDLVAAGGRRTAQPPIALTVLLVALLGMVARLAVKPSSGVAKVSPDTSAAADAEAKRLAVILDATIKAAHVQADTMAAGTQIRAGIMTDAATVKDRVTSEIQLPRNLNQTLELVQLRSTAARSRGRGRRTDRTGRQHLADHPRAVDARLADARHTRPPIVMAA